MWNDEIVSGSIPHQKQRQNNWKKEEDKNSKIPERICSAANERHRLWKPCQNPDKLSHLQTEREDVEVQMEEEHLQLCFSLRQLLFIELQEASAHLAMMFVGTAFKHLI